MHGWFSRKYDYDENEIVSMYQSGQSAYKIASALNLTPGVVYAVLEKSRKHTIHIVVTLIRSSIS